MTRVLFPICAFLLTGCTANIVAEGGAGPQPVIATLAELSDDPTRFEEQQIQVTGRVKYRNTSATGRWGFALFDEAGNALRCYEQNYRRQAPFGVGTILRKASYEKGDLRVAGYFTDDGELELDWVEYADARFDTDFTYRPLLFHGWGF